MPTVADIVPLKHLLVRPAPGEPIRHEALACVPLLAPGLDDPDWRTLDEAGEAVSITEVGEDGLVPELSVTNGIDHPLLLLDGQELVGFGRFLGVLFQMVVVGGFHDGEFTLVRFAGEDGFEDEAKAWFGCIRVGGSRAVPPPA